MIFPDRSVLLITGRVMVIVLVIIALWNPVIFPHRRAIDITILVDESASMDREFTANAWKTIQALTRHLKKAAGVNVIRFGSEPVQEILFSTDVEFQHAKTISRFRAINSNGTNIEAAVQMAMQSISPNRNNVIFLISDMRATNGDTQKALESAHQAEIPLYLIAPKDAGQPVPDSIQIKDVNMPMQASEGTKVPLTIVLSGAKDRNCPLVVKVGSDIIYSDTIDVDVDGDIVRRVWIDAKKPGLNVVSVAMGGACDSLTSALANRQDLVLDVKGRGSVLVVSDKKGRNPISASLANSGWPVITIEPGQFVHYENSITDLGVIVLDDISLFDMTPGAWTALISAVEGRGVGLLVLGGSRSFAGGGYRFSELEAILPVMSRARDPRPAAAVVFLIDASGSMGANTTGPTKLTLAKEAVRATFARLGDTDRVGITRFSTQPENVLALMDKARAEDLLNKMLHFNASGGTRLLPALQDGVAQLASAISDQKLLILVTDGFTDDNDLGAIRNAILENKIDVIVLAIGDEPSLDILKDISNLNEGRLLKIGDVAQLPRLMQDELSRRRAPVETGKDEVFQELPIPFWTYTDTDWPPITGNAVTVAKAEARSVLESGAGDPLLTIGRAGAGQVITMSSGFSYWAADWWRWPRMGLFLDSMISSLNILANDDDISLRFERQSDKLVLWIDAVEEGDWAESQNSELHLINPSGRIQQIYLNPVGPGQLKGETRLIEPGLYRIQYAVNEKRIQTGMWYGNKDEQRSRFEEEENLAMWLDAGVLLAVRNEIGLSPGDLNLTKVARKSVFVGCALLLYLLLLTYEYAAVSRVKRFFPSQMLWNRRH